MLCGFADTIASFHRVIGDNFSDFFAVGLFLTVNEYKTGYFGREYIRHISKKDINHKKAFKKASKATLDFCKKDKK